MPELIRPDFPHAIDNTMRSAFVLCPRKFQILYLLHKRAGGSSIDLDAGAAFAAGLEVTRREYFSGNLSAQAAIAAGARKLLASYPDREDERSPKTLDRVFGAFGYYFSVFPLESEYFTPVKTPNGPAVEFNFALPIPVPHPVTGDPILYCGRFDQLCDHRDGGLYIEDDKTTKQLGSSWASKWRMRSQFTGYCWGAREFGYPVRGAVVRGIAIRKTGFDHAEHITPRPKYMIDEWYAQLIRDVERMIAAWRSGVWDLNLADGCDMYGGCGFQEICSSGNPDLWIDQLDTHHWKPLRTQEDL